jgi:hypothetical protein
MRGFYPVCLPAHVEVELTRRVGSRVCEIPCVGRECERSPSQFIYAHPPETAIAAEPSRCDYGAIIATLSATNY